MNRNEAIETIRNHYPPENYTMLREALDLAMEELKGSDGSHTFDELYHHRAILFSVICRMFPDKAWKSWKHDDDSMFDNYFIVGLNTEAGQFTYHYHKSYWEHFPVKELEKAPKWDGHTSSDVNRLYSLFWKGDE